MAELLQQQEQQLATQQQQQRTQHQHSMEQQTSQQACPCQQTGHLEHQQPLPHEDLHQQLRGCSQIEAARAAGRFVLPIVPSFSMIEEGSHFQQLQLQSPHSQQLQPTVSQGCWPQPPIATSSIVEPVEELRALQSLMQIVESVQHMQHQISSQPTVSQGCLPQPPIATSSIVEPVQHIHHQITSLPTEP